MSYAIEQRFIKLANSMLKKAIPTPNATWRRIENDVVLDSDKPWLVTRGDIDEVPVRVLFITNDLQKREWKRCLDDTETTVGNFNALMADPGFEPSLKDVVLWDNREIKIISVKKIAPIKDTILYIMLLGL